MRAAVSLGAVICWAVLSAACGEDHAAKIRGWPPDEADRAWLRAIGEEAARAQEDDADEPEIPEVPVEAPEPAPEAEPPGPCRQLVDLACELFGAHHDSCHEARAGPPDESHPFTREGCEALVTRFRETEMLRGGGCYRYTRALCRVYGEASERCRTARATIQLARSRREHRICLGDWLILESRGLRR